MRLILQDLFWFVYVPFGNMVKFQFLAQFSVVHLSNPVVSRLMLLLRTFAAFVYYHLSIYFTIKFSHQF